MEASVTPRRSRSLVDAFAATVSRWGDRTALEAPDGVFTYDELAALAGGLAERLRGEGIGPGDRVGVRVPSGTAELYEAILGVLLSGAAYVPVDADDPPARAEAIWEDAGVCAVFEAGLELRRLPRARCEARDLEPGDDAWIIFTSGSTGRPKGVAASHGSAAALIDAESSLWEIEPEDRVLAGLSVGFDASCEEIWLAWRNGAALVPAPRSLVRAGAELGPWLRERRITVVSTVPTLAAIWDLEDLAGVRFLILGGEACAQELAWRLADGREVWNTYGPTEATVVTTAARVRPGEPVTIGRPLEGWEVAVIDEDGCPAAAGRAGELVIAGVGLARYIDSELDRDRFAGIESLGWERAYRTGDIVRETEAGLEFVGRRDDQVKVGGRRIELGEVDAQLLAAPGVTAAAAAVRRSEAGNPLLVGYVVGEVDPAAVRRSVAERLPAGLVPMIVALDSLPTNGSGKANRKELPWPPPAAPITTNGALAEPDSSLTGTAAWLAEQWIAQVGPVPVDAGSDFFELGGSSLAAAKLVSALRHRYPSVTVADVYHHRRLGELAARLDSITGEDDEEGTVGDTDGHRRWGAVQVAGVIGLIGFTVPQWVITVLAINKVFGASAILQVGWGWLVLGWILFSSPLGRAGIVLGVRRLLLGRLKPGRYPRFGWLACRIWFVERLAETSHLGAIAGTPWARRYAVICGAKVGEGAHLGALPSPTGLISIGPGATLEADVDAHGWWVQGNELVIDEVRVGAGARVGTRTMLMPGAEIGAGAEVEPGSVITGPIPAGERWAGSPAVHQGPAGESWPTMSPPPPRRARFWKAMYAVGLSAQSLLPMVALIPVVVALLLWGTALASPPFSALWILVYSLPIAASFLLSEAILTALVVRFASRLIKPGWHSQDDPTGWALWFTENLMAATRKTLFPLYSSIYTRPWLRLAGLRVGRRTEVSTAVGLNPAVSLAETSFAADDVVFATARSRNGWLHLEPIEVGSRTFLGNGALLTGSTRLGDDSLVGVITTPPRQSAAGSSWFGSPPLELPRVPDRPDPRRTIEPPARLIAGRAAIDLFRILFPGTVSVMLGIGLFVGLDAIANSAGILALALAVVPAMLIGGLAATVVTIAVKWILIGRYRPGEHPLWSFFVWRDEVINSCQEQLAGAWLLGLAMATPLMSFYLRVMGAKVGRGVWCETLTITEFDLVELGDGCAVNRQACVETHLFHDRLMRIGPIAMGAGSTLGPASVVLPDATIGAGCCVEGRSVVMRGEDLPPRTRWHGAPVVAV